MARQMSSVETGRLQREHGYETPRPDIQALVPGDATNILELGCSTGALGAALKGRNANVSVVGVELLEEYAADARNSLDRVVVSDAEAFVAAGRPPEAPFDCLIAADVLEHLVDPWGTLARAVDFLDSGGIAIASVPNALYWRALARVVRERRWPLDDQGTFDRTHLRWFSERDAEALFLQAGLTNVVVHPKYWSSGWHLRRDRLLSRTAARAFLGGQYLITGRKK